MRRPTDSVAKSPVGEPDEGNPHVRFDERGLETGGNSPRQLSTPINRLHWVLDATWGSKDAQQARDRTAARNLALRRKITLNLARRAPQQSSNRLSLKNVRNLAAWDLAYRNRLLGLA